VVQSLINSKVCDDPCPQLLHTKHVFGGQQINFRVDIFELRDLPSSFFKILGQNAASPLDFVNFTEHNLRLLVVVLQSLKELKIGSAQASVSVHHHQHKTESDSMGQVAIDKLSVLVLNIYWRTCEPVPWGVHDHALFHHVFV
jgi:hypothetical protein